MFCIDTFDKCYSYNATVIMQLFIPFSLLVIVLLETPVGACRQKVVVIHCNLLLLSQ